MEQNSEERKFFLARKGVTRLHLVLSASLISFMLTYYYYDYYYSVLSDYIELTCHIGLILTQGMNKTYVFLICNGILVILVRTAGSLIAQSNFDLKEHMYIKSIHDALHTLYDDDMVEDEELVIRVDGNEESDGECWGDHRRTKQEI
ncbi:hypothetical protein R6Q59_018602 [Mikania micrantha]